MSNYGLLIKNPSTQKAFDEEYVALNFVGAGITTYHSSNIYYLDVHCPTRPVLFYRSAEVNKLSAPHYVWDRGNGLYRVYTLGETEVFVFATTMAPSNENYGIRIWSRNGRLVYQSSDDPVLPVARISVPHGQNWYSGSSRKLAYALHGLARVIDHHLGSHQTVFHNTVIQSLPGGFGVRLYKTFEGRMSGDQFRHAFHGHPFNGFTDLHPGSPISMLVVDVHDLDYHGRQARTFY